MKTGTITLVIILTMILGATVLFAQENEDAPWGSNWCGWPVKPGEVFSHPERYWFYDNIDFSDTLKYTIHHTDSEEFEGVYIFVAWGFWDDPYRHSYEETHPVYDDHEYDDTRFISYPIERGRGYFYVVKYKTADGDFYSEYNNNDVSITTSRITIQESERFSLLERHVSNQHWYDIDFEDVTFDPGEFR